MGIFRFSKDNPFKVFLNKVKEGLDKKGSSYDAINDFLDFMPFTFEKQKEIFSYAAENFSILEIRNYSLEKKLTFFEEKKFEYILKVRFFSDETFSKRDLPLREDRIKLLENFRKEYDRLDFVPLPENLSIEDKSLISLLGKYISIKYTKELLQRFKAEILRTFNFNSLKDFYNIDLSIPYFTNDIENRTITFNDFSSDLMIVLSHDISHAVSLDTDSKKFNFLLSINLCLIFEQSLIKYVDQILSHKSLEEINFRYIVENCISLTLKRVYKHKLELNILNNIQVYKENIFSKTYNNYLLFFLLFNYLKNSVLSIEDSRKRDDNKIILDMKTTSIENRFINFLFIGQNYSFLDIDSLLRNMFFNTDKMRREDVNRIEGLSEWIDDDFGNCQIRICDIDEALFISELRGDSRVVKGSGVGTGTYHLLKKLGVYVKSFRGGYLSKNGEYYQGFMIMFSEPNNKGEFLTFEDFQKTRAYQNLIKNKVA